MFGGEDVAIVHSVIVWSLIASASATLDEKIKKRERTGPLSPNLHALAHDADSTPFARDNLPDLEPRFAHPVLQLGRRRLGLDEEDVVADGEEVTPDRLVAAREEVPLGRRDVVRERPLRFAEDGGVGVRRDFRRGREER